MARSAQWTSSTTSTPSPGDAPSSRRTAANSCSRAVPEVRASRVNSPPTTSAMSRTGASGRGVKRPSQAPTSQRASGRRSRKASTSADLPTPASPETRTNRPRPSSASAAHSPRAASWGSRSSRRMPTIVRPVGLRRLSPERGVLLGHGRATRRGALAQPPLERPRQRGGRLLRALPRAGVRHRRLRTRPSSARHVRAGSRRPARLTRGEAPRCQGRPGRKGISVARDPGNRGWAPGRPHPAPERYSSVTEAPP